MFLGIAVAHLAWPQSPLAGADGVGEAASPKAKPATARRWDVEIEVVVGPVPWAAARAWIDSARRTVSALRSDAPPVVPWDVVDLFERYVDAWDQVPLAESFLWRHDVPVADVEAMAVHWFRVRRARHELAGESQGRAALVFEAALTAGYERAFAAAAMDAHPQLARLAVETAAADLTAVVTRVLLVDPDPSRRGLVRVWLERQRGLDIVADVGDGHDAVRLARQLRPDVVVLDLDVPGLNGLATTGLLRDDPKCAVVVFSSGSGAPEALEAGADSYIDRDVAPGSLVGEIRRAAARCSATADLVVVVTHALTAPIERITSAATTLRTAVLEGRGDDVHETELEEIRRQIDLAMGILADVVRGGAALTTAIDPPSV